MANSIKNLPEIIENESQYDAALKQRRKSIAQFSVFGPPDLCYLTKEFHRSLNISFNKSSSFGFYHYNYGLCPSTPAAISAYVTRLLKAQETESNWFSNGKWLITKACYCMFDVFSRIDIYLEIMIPGGMRLYGIQPNEEIIQVDEKAWEKGYVSSVLRAMQPEKIPMVKLYKEFQRLEEMETFFQIILNSFDSLDIPIEPYELLSVKGNKMLNIICDYLVRKKRYQLAIKFFNYLVDYDFHNVVFLSNIFNSIGNNLDTLKLIAPLLQKNPHVFCLIYQEAYSLMQLKRYDLAGKLTKSLIQMIPESFEAWLLLIEIYFYSKNYEAALITLNIAPVTQKKTYNNGFNFQNEEKLLENGSITEPKEKGDSDYFYFNLDVEQPDFRYTKLNDEYKYIQQDYIEENKKQEEGLNTLPALKLHDHELRLYQILVKIEREITWEKLLLLRAKLFLMDENSSNLNNITNFQKNSNFAKNQPNNPVKNNEKPSSKIEDYEIYEERFDDNVIFGPNNTINERSFNDLKSAGDNMTKGHQKALEILNKKKPIESTEVLNETDEDDSDQEHELPSFLKPEEESKPLPKPKSNQIVDKKGDLSGDMSQSIPVVINNPGSFSVDERLAVPVKPIKMNENLENLANFKKKGVEVEENEKELHSHELSIRNMTKKPWMEGVAFENPLLDFSKKRLCSKLTDMLFEALYEDLNALYEWSQEEYNRQSKRRRKKPESNDDENEEYEGKDEEEEEEYIEDLRISGRLWVLRGILAQRLLRNRFAETAYRKAVERGFSLYAWKKLLEIYLEIENYKATLVCVAEILDELENEGVENFVFLPRWIEEAILEIISRSGFKGLTNLLSELNLDDPSINDLIKEAAYWKVEGSGSV